jgi:hypothetical protein
MKTYKFKFSGKLFCTSEKKMKSFNRGEPVTGEFEGMLDHTYKIVTERPKTSKNYSSRDFTVKQAKEKMEGMSEEEIKEFTKGDTRKSL